jgi:dTDP-4-amino-4,6-dideoxygalactose transaminase
MSPSKLKEYLNKNSDVNYVIFINHLGYIGEDLFEIKEICDFYNVELIEDSAQGLGQIYSNTMPGLIGKFGIYSFSGAKLLRSGEGGCFISKDIVLSEKVEKLSFMGIGNYIMSPLSAIFLNKQLEDIDELIEKRNKIFRMYNNLNLEILKFPLDYNTGYHTICYLLKNRSLNSIKSLLNKNKFEFRYNFYKPLTNDIEKIPVSYTIYKKYIELPQSYDLENKDVEFIAKFLKTLDI